MVYTKPIFKMPNICNYANFTISKDYINNNIDVWEWISHLSQYEIFLIYIFNIFIVFPFLIYLCKKPRGNIFIVRGLHGIGKNNVAKKIINDYKPNSYIHIDMYDNWNHSSNRKSHYIQLMKCNNNSLKDYMLSMENGIECIIITNPFVKKWEYKIYIDLAKKYNYDWSIYQLEAESKDHAKYFGERSSHKLPILGNNYLYDKWEHDERGINIEPDYSELPGDSLPQYNIKRHLDFELEEYMKNN